MPTTASLVTRCETRFRDSGHAIVSAADWLEYLNDAYREVNGQQSWPWMEARKTSVTFASGDNAEDLGVDVYRVLSVHNSTDHYPLHPLEGRAEFRDEFPDETIPGSSVNYRLRGGGATGSVLEVWPIPNHTFTTIIEYYGPPADLVSGSVNPVWPSQYHGALVEGALGRAYRDDGNKEWADDHMAAMEAIVASMTQDLMQGARNESYPRVLDNWF
jgi:hypothetical protein